MMNEPEVYEWTRGPHGWTRRLGPTPKAETVLLPAGVSPTAWEAANAERAAAQHAAAAEANFIDEIYARRNAEQKAAFQRFWGGGEVRS